MLVFYCYLKAVDLKEDIDNNLCMKSEDNICEKFGRTIKTIRVDRKISQEKFALSIGLDRTYYSSVENGKRNISLNNIKK